MKTLKANQPETRRQYDITLKREAVQNWFSSDKPAGVVGEELGMSSDRLYA